MFESIKTRFWRLAINLYPPYLGSGGRVKYIAPDWREVRVELPFNWRTKGRTGAIFGGSIYAAIDPFYALMVANNVGADYVVWDKSAKIRYRRPARSRLHVQFLLGDGEKEEILRSLTGRESVDRTYIVELTDDEGDVKARVEKVVYIGRREPPGRLEGKMREGSETREISTEKEAG